MTSRLSRRSFFTTIPGWLGISGCYSAPRFQKASSLALRLSAAGSVNFNIMAEQPIEMLHGSDAKLALHQIILVDVIQDDPMVDISALRWAPGYPAYDEAASTDTTVRVLIKFAVPAGVPTTGRARVLLSDSASASRGLGVPATFLPA